MIYMTKKTVLLSILFLMAFSFMFHLVSGDINALAGEDNIVIGHMNEYTPDFIIVENIRYMFCEGVKFFNTSDEEIPLGDIDGALEVELYGNNRCISKVKVLGFAQ